jgi:hypothetical protein
VDPVNLLYSPSALNNIMQIFSSSLVRQIITQHFPLLRVSFLILNVDTTCQRFDTFGPFYIKKMTISNGHMNLPGEPITHRWYRTCTIIARLSVIQCVGAISPLILKRMGHMMALLINIMCEPEITKTRVMFTTSSYLPCNQQAPPEIELADKNTDG